MPRQAIDFAAMGSNLGRAMMSAGGAKDAAYLDATKKMADIDMAQGRGEYFRAQADDLKLKAAEARRFEDAQKPENITRIATGLAGLTEDKVSQVHDYFTNGNFGITPGNSLPVDQAGPTTPDVQNPAPGWATPEALARIGQYRGALSAQGSLAGKSDFANLIGGMKGIWEQQQLDDAKSGKFTPEMARGMNGLEAAKKGNLYGVHEFGTFNNATGNLDFNQPYLDKNASTIAQNRAQAASAYSTANLNRARIPEVQSQIDLNRAKIGAEGVGGKWQVIQTANWAAQVNPATGEVRPLMMDGKPVLSPKSQAKETQDIQASISTQQVLDQAATLFKHPGRSMGTGASSFMSAFPGTDARGFKANLDTFKAQTFVPMVSALKGMGALSDAEGKKLSDSVGALDPSMPEKEFEKSLQGVTKILYEKAKAAGLNVSMPDFSATGETIKPPENAGAGSGPTDAAIAHLKQNPNLAPAFAAKYGKEATDAALGKVR